MYHYNMIQDKKTKAFIRDFLRLYYKNSDLSELVGPHGYCVEDVFNMTKALEENNIVTIAGKSNLIGNFQLNDETSVYLGLNLVLRDHINKDILLLQKEVLDECNIHTKALNGENPEPLDIKLLKESSRIREKICNL